MDTRELVAFVGAGGKKTAIAQLAAEASEQGHSVAYTTTTHTPPLAGVPTYQVSPEEFIVAAPDDVPAAIRDESPVAFVCHSVENPERAERKARGYAPGTVDTVFETDAFDWLLVKADGARRREFKAPDDDEPVVPDASTHVVPVASVSVVGQQLVENYVHRPERVSAITGLERGEQIPPEAVGQVIASPDGGCKAVPAGATVTPVVNKADTVAEQATASAILETAIDRSDRIDRGIVTSFRADYCEVVTADDTPVLPE